MAACVSSRPAQARAKRERKVDVIGEAGMQCVASDDAFYRRTSKPARLHGHACEEAVQSAVQEGVNAASACRPGHPRPPWPMRTRCRR